MLDRSKGGARAGAGDADGDGMDDDWDEDDWECDDDTYTLDTDGFFVVEPGVRAEINLFKFMRLNAGVSYRYAAGLDLIYTPGNLLNNFTGTVGLKFGKF